MWHMVPGKPWLNNSAATPGSEDGGVRPGNPGTLRTIYYVLMGFSLNVIITAVQGSLFGRRPGICLSHRELEKMVAVGKLGLGGTIQSTTYSSFSMEQRNPEKLQWVQRQAFCYGLLKPL